MEKAESTKRFQLSKEYKQKVRCRFCLDKEFQLKNLSKHVRDKHPNYYKNRTLQKEYVAREGQTVPDDHAYGS